MYVSLHADVDVVYMPIRGAISYVSECIKSVFARVSLLSEREVTEIKMCTD